MTGDQIINEALTLLGVLFAGQTPSTEAKATTLLGLNNLLGEWNAQGRAVFSIVRATYALTAAKVDYTIGAAAGAAGGDLNAKRPEKIESWAVRSPSSGSDGGKPVDAATFTKQRELIDREAWELGLLPTASLAGVQGLRVKILNYDAAYPVGTIHVYPAPAAGMSLDIWTWEQLDVITDTTLDVDLPQGYMKAIVYSLADDVANKFGREAPASVTRIATACKLGLAGTNTSELTRRDPAVAPPAQQQ